MALRLIEVVVPEDGRSAIEAAMDERPTLASWATQLEGDRIRFTFLLGGEAIEDAMAVLQERIEDIADARLLMAPIEVTLPRPEAEVEDEEARAEAEGREEQVDGAEEATKQARVTTPELYQKVLTMSELTASYIALVVLSSIVAAFGLLSDSLIAVIGAMVIAPLIGPNVGMALATTLADERLAGTALVANLGGLAAALVTALVIGVWLPVDPQTPVLAGRTVTTVLDIGLAVAAGAAAVLSLTVGVSTALVGVMVAVALLPPVVAVGLFLGSGFTDLAWRAGLLAVSVLIAINLAGVVTFAIQGVRPTQNWEAERASYATVIVVLAWTALLATLVYIVWFGVGVEVGPSAAP